jgi:hypothetical protein
MKAPVWYEMDRRGRCKGSVQGEYVRCVWEGVRCKGSRSYRWVLLPLSAAMSTKLRCLISHTVR